MIYRIFKSRKIKKIRKKASLFISSNILRDTISVEKLCNEFKNTGIKPCDKVMIHASLSSLGNLENGAQTFIEALKQYVTKDGLIVMPTFSMMSMHSYLESDPIFDVLNTPSVNGSITEALRHDKESIRSLHPTSSLVAWGKDAVWYMQGHENSYTPFDEKSPYRKLIDTNVKILFVGIDMFSMSLCRAGDDMIENYPVHPYLEKRYKVRMIDYNGKSFTMETACHNPSVSKRRRNMKLYPYFEPHVAKGYIGKTPTLMIHAQDVFNVQKQCVAKGITTYFDYQIDK